MGVGMARRRRRSNPVSGTLILGVLLLAALGWLIDFVETNQEAILNVIVVVFIIGIVVLIVSCIQRGRQRRSEAADMQRLLVQREADGQARRRDLMLRYRNLEIVDAIINRQVLIGMTREQLIESWGHPHDIKQTILKTKRKEEFKYTNVGANRYLSRVFLENDEVVGWKQ